MSTWTLEVLAPFTMQQHGQITTWQPGQRMTLPQEKAQRVLDYVGDKVRLLDGAAPPEPSTAVPIALQPLPPLQPGWLVVYHSLIPQTYKGQVVYPLVGGCTDRAHGTVSQCIWSSARWRVCLTDGSQLPLEAIRGVARTNQIGEVMAAWITSVHGYEGEGT
jgi:hypothetical protein